MCDSNKTLRQPKGKRIDAEGLKIFPIVLARAELKAWQIQLAA